MPKNQVSDPITDQEIAFARLVLSGTVTDRAAAEAVGLNPDTAAYTKAKPRVRAYMLEHRAAVHQQFVEQDTGELRRFTLGREQVLARLWEIANLAPETTRGSASAQVKALALIVAMEGLIPDRRAIPAQNNSAPPRPRPEIYVSEWLREQQAKTTGSQPSPDPVQDEDGPGLPDPPPGAPAEAPSAPSPAFHSSESLFAHPSEPTLSPSHAPGLASAPDTRVPFSIKKRRFGRRY